jgi:hypothetical protein
VSRDDQQEKEPEDEASDEAVLTEPPSQRARLAIALGAALFLGIIVGAVVLVGASGSDRPGLPTGTCFKAWNEDPIAPIQDGQHAYNAHGYRQVLVTRIDRDLQIVEEPLEEEAADAPAARCAVIFAAPQPDFEPDFGVRIYDSGRWFGLAVTDKATLDDIGRLQSEAVPVSNSLLTASGKVGSD